MDVDVKWWCYPYVFFRSNFIPLSVFFLCIFCIGLSLYIILSYIIYRKVWCIKVEWRKQKIYQLFFYIIIVFFISAYAQTDSQYVLYQVVSKFAENIRQIDIFLYGALLILFFRGMRYRNSYTYHNRIIKYLICINTIEMITILFTQNEKGSKGYIQPFLQSIILFAIIVVNCVLQDIKFQNIAKKEIISERFISDKIQQKQETLFEERCEQLEEIYKKILTYSSDEQMTIFVSDEWGGGKTYFSRVLYEKLKQTNDYTVIWLDMNDFGETDTLIKQIFKRIQLALEEDNYYVGSSSEVEKYFDAILDVTVNKSLAKLISEHLKNSELNCIRNGISLTEMAQDFSDMLGESKIVIILDDLDRCSEETISATVKLFSDMIYFPKSIVVFAGDYKQLLNKQDFTDGFFDKYFMYNYNLNPISYMKLLTYFQGQYNDKLDRPIEFDIAVQVSRMISDIKVWIEKENKNGIAQMPNLEKGELRKEAISQSIILVYNLEEGIKKLEKQLSNPRRIIRIFNEISDQLRIINHVINENNIENNNALKKLIEEIVFPGILFYSLARTVCIEKFWDYCSDDFIELETGIMDTLTEINTNKAATDEEYIYMLLVYYFFSSRFNSNRAKICKICEFYKTSDLGTFIRGEI